MQSAQFTATLSSPTPPPPRVGAQLRAAREALGWSLTDTAAYLRIRRPLLDALETGRAQELPNPVFVQGFIRAYAKAVGLNGDALAKRYLTEVGGAVQTQELNFPAPVPTRRIAPGVVMLFGAVLTVLGYGGWLQLNANTPDSVPVQQIPARLAPLAMPVVPPPPKAVALAAPPTAAPAKTASITTLPAVSPSAAEASVPPPGSLNPVDPPQAVGAGHTAPSQLVLTATEDAWVQITDANGHIVLSKLMHKGESWVVPASTADTPPLLLTTGNAGGTQLSVDGKTLPSLGADGAVRHNVRLDVADLRSGADAAKSAGQSAATRMPSGQG